MKKIAKLNLMGFFFFVFCLLFLSSSYSEVPYLINYQGKLTDQDDNPVADIAHYITFRIYDAETGAGTMEPWKETQSIRTQEGIFSCLLGATNDLNLPFDRPYWLEIVIGGEIVDGELVSGGEVMDPRQRIGSAGYAIRARTAEKLETQDIINAQGGLVIESRTFDPPNPVTGQIWFRSDL